MPDPSAPDVPPLVESTAGLDDAPTAWTPIPRRPGLPLLGNLLQIPKGRLIQHLTESSRAFDGLFELDFAGHPARFVTSAALVAELCDEKRFRKALGPGLTMLRALGGDGLFTSRTHEPNWGKAHRILLPAFGQRAMRSYFGPMRDVAQQLVAHWRRRGPEGDIPVTDDMTRLTLDTIARCGFGYDFRSFDSEALHPFIESMVRALAEALGQMTRLPAQNALRRGARRQFEADIAFMHALVDDVIAQRRRAPTTGTDLLNLMLAARDPLTDEAIDDVNIRYQVVTFLIAGHETTSGLLSFALYELMRHPAVMAQAYAEVDRVLPGDRVPEYADLARLPVLDRVLKETLRRWPTAPAFAVAPFEDTVIGGRYRIREGERLTVVIPALHRDPLVWAQPERFDIDRFLPEREAALPAHAYKPFGNGQRACIGRQFAWTEAKLALALILQQFKLDDPYDYRFRIAETLTIKPEGFVLRASPRGPHERLVVPETDTGPAARPAARPPDHAQAIGEPRLQTTAGGEGALKVVVAWASTLGTARELATRVADDAARAGLDVDLLALDELVDAMPVTGLLVVVASTYNGQPADGAKAFDRAIDERWPALRLPDLRVALLGCGDSQWPTYQQFPRRLETFFLQAGATLLMPRGEADGQGDFDAQAESWLDALRARWPAPTTETASPSALQVSIADPLALRAPLLPAGTWRLTVVDNRELTADATGLWPDGIEAPRPSTREIRLQIPTGVSSPAYRTGDHLAVYPSNSSDRVAAVLDRLGVAPHARVTLHRPGRARHAGHGLPLDEPVSAAELLTHFVELQDVPSRAALGVLAAATGCPHTRSTLRAWAGDDPEHGYAASILAPRLSTLDVLQRWPAIELDLGGWLSICAPIRPRLYSIASAAEAEPARIAIAVGHVAGQAWSGRGTYQGVASGYLADSRIGDTVLARVQRPTPAFAPVFDRPMILVGAGTGIAPFRAFIEARAVAAARPSAGALPPAWLFAGCRHPAHDGLYTDEFEAWSRQGLVTLHWVPSAHRGPRRFVQHALAEAADDVWALWQQGAIVYVCGDGRQMAPAVRQALLAMYRARAGASEAEASDWLIAQMQAGRYRQDVFE